MLLYVLCNATQIVLCVLVVRSQGGKVKYVHWRTTRINKVYSKTAPFLTITGGEPTLLKDNFFGLLKTLQYDFDETRFLLLTNGRAFSDYSFTQRFVECLPNNIRVGIPIYGYNETTHDIITQSAGSFKQAVIGIHNLLHYNIETEIRIVLTKQNIDNIEKIAKYVIKYFRDVACVNFMGLELMGNAAKIEKKCGCPLKMLSTKVKSYKIIDCPWS